MESKR